MLKIDKLQLEVIINGDPARLKLQELQQKANALTREMRGIKDQELLGKKKDELASLQRAMEDIRHEIGLDGMTMKELGQRAKELQAILSNLRPGTDEFKKYKAELDDVNARQKELKGVTDQNAISWRRMWEIAGGVGMAEIARSAIRKLTGYVEESTEAFNNFQSKISELSALTGLAGEDLNWLADQAKKLSTTTTESGVKITASAEGIIDAYKLMGSARPDLLQNKEALVEVTKQALILAEAGKMETAPAIEAVAASMNQFNLGANQSAKVINTLSAGALVGAAEISDLTGSMKNVGAVANDSNLSLEQTVAALEVLSLKALKGEESGTKLRGAILKMKEAGLGYASGQFNMTDAMEEANKKLASLGSEAEKDALKIKYFGAENITAGTILLNNIETYKNFTTQVTNTDEATRQATVNTNNNKAALAQAKNEAALVSIAFGEKLSPALLATTHGTTAFLKIFMAVIDFIARNIKTITAIAAGIAAYTIAVNAQTIATKAYSMATEFADRVTKAFNTTAKQSPWGILAGIIAAVTVAIVAFRKEQDLASKGFGEFTAQLQKDKGEMNNLFEIVKKSNEGSQERAAAIKELNEKYKEYLPNLLTEKSTLDDIEKAQNAANAALTRSLVIKSQQADREKVINESLEKQKDATKNLLDEISSSKGDTVASVAAKSMEGYIKSYRELNKEIGKSSPEQYAKSMDMLREFSKKFGVSVTDVGRAFVDVSLAQQKEEKQLKKIDELYSAFKVGATDVASAQKSAADADAEANKKSAKELTAYQKERVELYRKYIDEKRGLDSALSKDEEKQLREYLRANKIELNKNLDAEEQAYAKHLTALNTDYYNARIKHEEDLQKKLKDASNPKERIEIENKANIELGVLDEKHKRDLEDAESAHILTRITLTKNGGGEIGKLEEELAKHKIDVLERRNKEADKLHKAEIKGEENAEKTRAAILKKYGLEDFRATMNEQLSILEKSLDAENLSYEDKLKIRAKIADKFAYEMAEKQRQQDEDRIKNASKQALSNKLSSGQISQADYNKQAGIIDGNNNPETNDNGKKAGLLGQLANVKSAEQIQLELNKAAFDQGIINKTEFEKKQNEITKEATDQRVKIIQNGIDNIQKIESSLGNFISSMQEAQSINLKTKQDKETQDLEDQHDKKLISDKAYNTKKKELDKKHDAEEKALKKKNANINFIIQVAQIMAATAKAVAESVAASPLTFGLPWSAFATAEGIAQVAVANAQKNAVNQLAKGKYDVVGADDNKLYTNVPYVATATTGIYKKPTLIAEKEEMVIDNPTLNNLRYNAPYIFDIIEKNRVKQFAEGNYPQQYANGIGSRSGIDSDTLIQFIVENSSVMRTLNDQLVKGINTKFSVTTWKENVEPQYDAFMNDVKK